MKFFVPSPKSINEFFCALGGWKGMEGNSPNLLYSGGGGSGGYFIFHLAATLSNSNVFSRFPY